MALKVSEDNKNIIVYVDSKFLYMEESEQRELLVWLWNHKPLMCRDVLCENCPEVC